MTWRTLRADSVEPNATVARGGEQPERGAAWQPQQTRVSGHSCAAMPLPPDLRRAGGSLKAVGLGAPSKLVKAAFRTQPVGIPDGTASKGGTRTDGGAELRPQQHCGGRRWGAARSLPDRP